tara:strand:- start:242 stop:628 length:387 start_codon:yes stop_codon:yes gene_type:complete
MIKNIIYASPHSEDISTDSKVIYTNSINETINRRYCILRSELVILLDKDVELQKECEWLDIPWIFLQDISKLQGNRFYIFSKLLQRHTLNEMYSILKPLAEEKDITIFSEGSKAAGTLVATAIKERIK